MKEITLRIPEENLDFFMELVKKLGIEVTDEVEIYEEHKTVVRERVITARSEDMVPWKEARKRLKFKDSM